MEGEFSYGIEKGDRLLFRRPKGIETNKEKSSLSPFYSFHYPKDLKPGAIFDIRCIYAFLLVCGRFNRLSRNRGKKLLTKNKIFDYMRGESSFI